MTKTIELKNAKFVETTFEDGSKQLVGTVRGDSFVGLDIPSDPNPRQFTGDSNPYYRDMVKTLKTEPELFSRKNAGGITIFADSCDNNGNGSYTLTLKKGNGISNGGHSFNALKHHGTDRSQVRVTIEIGLDNMKRVEIAEALNLNKKLQSYSLEDKRGAYGWHKNAIGEKTRHIIYHEGDSGVIDVKESLAYLNLFKYNDESNTLDILNNLLKSDRANVDFLKRIAKESERYNYQLKWIAKDVHSMMVYTLFNPDFVNLLKPLKASNGQNWLKTRNNKVGIIKGLALLIIAGLATSGTKLNKNDIVIWKPGFERYENRIQFINELFSKLLDIVAVEEGSPSQIIRQESVKQKVLKHAELITARSFNTSKKKRKVA